MNANETDRPERSALPDLTEVEEVLARTPGTLRALLSGLHEAWLLADEGPDTFSPREVPGHLIHGEKTDWMPRIERILQNGAALPFDPFDRFAHRERIKGVPTGTLLGEFESLRHANLGRLQALSLTPSQFGLEGQHPVLGRVTLGMLLATWAVHDLSHIGQIVRVMSKRYETAVGPWKANLGVLNR
jgi:hypothetical protein